MNTTELSQVYQVLIDRRQEIARTWLNSLAKIRPMSLDMAELQPHLTEYTEQIIDLLTSDPFDPSAAQDIGKMLEGLEVSQPKDLIRLQEILAQALVEGLSDAQLATLYPRLVTTLNAMGAGFFVGKVERAKRFDMDAMSKMGHDLKTPINAITGFSRVILKGIDGPITDFQQQDLTSIYDAGFKLLTMINDLFEVAKSDAGKTYLYSESFDVAELLGDVLKTSQPILAKQGHTLAIRAIGDLGAMQADASQVRWVLLSLLFYASRLVEKSTISLIALREKVQDVDWLFFEVTRMLPEEFSDLASPSRRQPKTDTPDQSNLEIGLIVCQRFCEEMGGSLTMVEDKLAKFTVQLPARVVSSESSL